MPENFNKLSIIRVIPKTKKDLSNKKDPNYKVSKTKLSDFIKTYFK